MRHAISVFAATLLIAAPLAGAVLPTTPAQVQTSDDTVDAVDDTVDAVDDAAPGPSVPLSQHVQSHPPIRIEDDQGPQGIVVGHANGQPVYRAGSGVMVGSGTAEDPYVISGWEIAPRRIHTGPGGDGDRVGQACKPSPVLSANTGRFARLHAIEIVNTDAHIVIRDNRIVAQDVGTVPGAGPVPGFAQVEVNSQHLIGILLKNADNVRIEGNQIGDMDGDQLYRGICAKQSDNLEIVGNQVENVASDAIEVTNADGLRISGNDLRDGGGVGIDLEQTPGAVVKRNTVRGFAPVGIDTVWAPDIQIDHNTVENNGKIGIEADSNNALVTDNVVRGHDWDGISVSSSTGVSVHGNNIEDNDLTGVDAFDSSVDAENNYWGCPNGPTDAACDDVEGNVDYSPWLSSPNSDAGA